MKKFLLSIGLPAYLLCSNSSASTIWNEGFGYSTGPLTSVSGGAWSAISGAGNFPITVVAGSVSLTNVNSGASGEDLRRPLDSTYTTGTLYAGMLVSLTTAPPGASGDYFLAFYSSAGSGGGFASRVFASTTATGWSLGLANASVSTPADWTTDLTLNTWYKVILKYDVATRTSALGVFSPSYTPTSDAELTLTALTASAVTAGIDYFALRQGSTFNSTMGSQVDEIWVGSQLSDVAGVTPFVPEPSALAIVGMGFLGMLLRRRK